MSDEPQTVVVGDRAYPEQTVLDLDAISQTPGFLALRTIINDIKDASTNHALLARGVQNEMLYESRGAVQILHRLNLMLDSAPVAAQEIRERIQREAAATKQ